MTLPVALEFWIPENPITNPADYTFYSWATINSTSTPGIKTIGALPGGNQNVFFAAYENELSIQFEVLSDDPLTSYTGTAFNKCIVFDDDVRSIYQAGAPNWNLRITYSDQPVGGSGRTGNPSVWTGKILSFNWSAEAGEHFSKIGAQVVFVFDNTW